jgi:hypothetical protein
MQTVHAYGLPIAKRILAIAVTALALAAVSLEALAERFNPGCGLPFRGIAQERPIDRNCAASGSAKLAGLRLQDKLKNNFCASGPPIGLDFDDFVHLQREVEKKQVQFGSETTLMTDRSVLKRIGGRYRIPGEGSLVKLAGVIAAKHYSAWAEAESVNCRLQGAENADIQVSVVPHNGDDLCQSVLVEISPHMRPPQWVQLFDLKTQSPVRFTGQLFFDASHKTCRSQVLGELPRISLWEIHPVYEIDICKHDMIEQCDVNDDGVWTPLDQWRNTSFAAVKLAFNDQDSRARVGQPFSLKVLLQGAASEPSSRSTETTVAITIISNSGKAEVRLLRIPAGQSSATLTFEPREAGFVRIEARSPVLRGADAVVNVLRPTSLLRPSVESGHFQPAAYSPVQAKSRTRIHIEVPGNGQVARIRIFSSPARELMANGSDAATISALVDGDVAHQDIAIQIHSTLGSLEPCDSQEHALSGVCPDTVLVIPKGASSSFVELQSNHMGDARISYVPTRKDIIIEDAPAVIQFGPPITRIAVTASPPRISLVDNSNILVQLTDDKGKIYVPARARRVTLSIQQGEGRLDSRSEIVIAPPNTNAVTSFTPGFWLGAVDLEVTADELSSTHLRLYVTPPIWLLLISVAGGLAGGMIAYQQNRQDASIWRIPIGALTGFIFYWAFIFGLFSSKSAVINPMSDFALSVVGGWVGTNVFTLLLKQFGIAT